MTPSLQDQIILQQLPKKKTIHPIPNTDHYNQIANLQSFNKNPHDQYFNHIQYFICTPFYKNNREFLVYNNNRYNDRSNHHAIDKGKAFWYCKQYPKCKGSIHTNMSVNQYTKYGEYGAVTNFKPCTVPHSKTWTLEIATTEFVMHTLCMLYFYNLLLVF